MGSALEGLAAASGFLKGKEERTRENELLALQEKQRKENLKLQRQKMVTDVAGFITEQATNQGLQLSEREFKRFVENINEQLNLPASADISVRPEFRPTGAPTAREVFETEKGIKEEELEIRREAAKKPSFLEQLAMAQAMTEAIARTKGKVKASLGLGNIKNITEDVMSVLGKFKKISPALKGPLAGRTSGQLAKLAKTDPNLSAFEDFKQFILSNISRQLGGERGVLTDRDISRIQLALPSLADTEESAALKIEQILDFIDRRVKEQQKIAQVEQTGIGFKPTKAFIKLEEIEKMKEAPEKQEQPKNAREFLSNDPELQIYITP